MYSTQLLFLVCICISLSADGLSLDGLARTRPSLVDDDTGNDETFIEKDSPNDDLVGDSDFEDDYHGDFLNSFDSEKMSVHSVTHLHEKQGEVLLPCFGMWWPVGGGPSYYDYGGGDYDGGDKKKKRRRSRRQRKAARTKKRRS